MLVPNRKVIDMLNGIPTEGLDVPKMAERRLVAACIHLDLFTQQDLTYAIKHRDDPNDDRTLEQILFTNEKVNYETKLRILGLQQGMNFVSLEQHRIPELVLRSVNPEIVRANHVVPFQIQETASQKIVWMLLSNPQDASAKDAIKKYFQSKGDNYDVEFLVAMPDEIEKIIDSRYTATASFEEQEEDEDEEIEIDTDLGPAQEFFSRVFSRAVELHASDVHIEGDSEGGGGLQVRMRIDGRLSIVERADKKFKDAILAVMKLNFGMDVAERRRPQSGRASRKFDGRRIDFRAETLPTMDTGDATTEDVTVRLLDKGSLSLNLDDMNWNQSNLTRFRQSYRKPYGAILVTGPTGSGKTSTLYAVLKELTVETDKLITIEDPVEYQLPGLRQVHVNERAGRTFPGTLRAILRSDPDTIMVGEIRDEETANIAMRAANTGHLVLSTLHTNEAAMAPIQLKQMGVPDYVIADALACVVGQRLIRKLCPHCRRKYVPNAVEIRSLFVGYTPQQVEQAIEQITAGQYEIFEADTKGCGNCSKGYSGRQAIHEVLQFNDEEKAVMLDKESTALRLRETAKQNGMHTLRQDAIFQVLQGVTDFDEVRRVTG